MLNDVARSRRELGKTKNRVRYHQENQLLGYEERFCSSRVSIRKYLLCKKRNAMVGKQLMNDLPIA